MMSAQSDFQVKRIVADGYCFYRCIALEVYNTQNKHDKVRAQIVEHMIDKRDLYTPFIDGSFDQHVENQKLFDGRVASWASFKHSEG